VADLARQVRPSDIGAGFRVLTYALLMCEEYPPFRFDPGGPDAPPVPSTDPAPMRPDGPAALLLHPPAI